MNEKYKVGSRFYVVVMYVVWIITLAAAFLTSMYSVVGGVGFLAASYVVYNDYEFYGRKKVEEKEQKIIEEPVIEAKKEEVIQEAPVEHPHIEIESKISWNYTCPHCGAVSGTANTEDPLEVLDLVVCGKCNKEGRIKSVKIVYETEKVEEQEDDN